MAEDDTPDPYELLGVDWEASDKEVQTAYRKLSLKWHPDKNPDNPDAVNKFEQLTIAKETLLDATKRAEIDKHRKAKRDLIERYAQEDSKRKVCREELEERERRADSRVTKTRSMQEEMRMKHAQADFAERIKARVMEKERKQLQTARELLEVRSVENTKLLLKWRSDSPMDVEKIKKGLADFGLVSVTRLEGLEAVVELKVREDALRAILHCREQGKLLGFRLAMMDKSKKMEASNGAQPGAQPKEGKTGKKRRAPGDFKQFEKSVLGDLALLAQAQKAQRAVPAS